MKLPRGRRIENRKFEIFICISQIINEVDEVPDGVPHLVHVVPHLPLHAVIPVMLQAPQTLLKHPAQKGQVNRKLFLQRVF